MRLLTWNGGNMFWSWRNGGILLLLIAPVARAQFDQGQIAGAVKDASEAVVPGAKVTATSLQTGAARSTETGANGNYILTNLPVGLYEVSVEGTGFKRFVKMNVKVDAASRTTLDATIEVFNLPNHPVLNNPNVDPRSGSFGLVSSKSNERNLQLGLKLVF